MEVKRGDLARLVRPVEGERVVRLVEGEMEVKPVGLDHGPRQEMLPVELLRQAA
jgi:hypothetical protein